MEQKKQSNYLISCDLHLEHSSLVRATRQNITQHLHTLSFIAFIDDECANFLFFCLFTLFFALDLCCVVLCLIKVVEEAKNRNTTTKNLSFFTIFFPPNSVSNSLYYTCFVYIFIVCIQKLYKFFIFQLLFFFVKCVYIFPLCFLCFCVFVLVLAAAVIRSIRFGITLAVSSLAWYLQTILYWIFVSLSVSVSLSACVCVCFYLLELI